MPKRPPIHRPHARRTEEQRKADHDAFRESASNRGYDRKWQALRAVMLRAQPLCVFCLAKGKIVQALVVDHIVPISKCRARRLDPTNLRSLCKPCHDAHTAKEQGFASRSRNRKIE